MKPENDRMKVSPSGSRRAALLLTTLALAACAEPGVDTPSGESGTTPAVLVVTQTVTPDDYFTYVRVYPDVPEGHVEFSKFREFGNANAYTFGGYVFVEEDGIVQRFSVNDELELVDGPRVSWQELGVGESNATYTVFVSQHRAYSFAADLGVVVVWDPETMESVGSLPLDLPRPAAMETWAYDGYVVGDKVFWNVFSGDFEGGAIYPAVTVAVADAERDEPVRIIEDSRCLPGGGAHVDENGDYYVQGGAFFGYFYVYGSWDNDARTCLLRINAGETDFDADYVVDFEGLLGSPVADPWYHVSGDQYVVRSWDPEVSYPEDPDELYDNPALRPLLVDLGKDTVRPYPALEGLVGVDGVTREVDGKSYYQLSETGYVEGGNAEIVELRTDGIEPRFSLDGFLLGLERIR